MKKPVGNFVYWTPRILSIIFITFLALISFDVISSGLSVWQIIIGMFMHNIPVFILIVLLVLAWKHEIIGGVTFIVGGLLYLGLVAYSGIKDGFEWYMLAWAIEISGIAFLIAALFLVGWERKKKLRLVE